MRDVSDFSVAEKEELGYYEFTFKCTRCGHIWYEHHVANIGSSPCRMGCSNYNIFSLLIRYVEYLIIGREPTGYGVVINTSEKILGAYTYKTLYGKITLEAYRRFVERCSKE